MDSDELLDADDSKILQFLQFIRETIDPKRNFDRKTKIRTVLCQAREIFPYNNAAIFEKDLANPSLEGAIFDQEIQLEDNFTARIVIFKKGTIAVFHGINDAKRWGNFKIRFT